MAPLVIGYGNPLRGDDGVGWHAARLLAADGRLRRTGTTVMARHQLTPELAGDVAGASLVVLVDASAEVEAGAVSVSRVIPGEAPAWSHQMQPPALAALASWLYGAAPPTFVVSVGAAAFAAAEELSPLVEAALPAAVEAVVELTENGGEGVRDPLSPGVDGARLRRDLGVY